MDRATGVKRCKWEKPKPGEISFDDDLYGDDWRRSSKRRSHDDDDDVYNKDNCDRQYKELFMHITYLLYPIVMLIILYFIVIWISCCARFGMHTRCARKRCCDSDSPWNCYELGCINSPWYC